MTAEAVQFQTSGSTGTPVSWIRTLDQVRAEGSLMAAALPGRPQAVLNFADPSHLYGRIFGAEVGRSLDVPTTQVDSVLGPVDVPAVEELLVVAVPSTWRVLSSRAWLGLPRLTVVHGAGPLPAIAREVLAGFETPPTTLEVFGSTECGGIALREVVPGAAPAPWRAVDDVTVLEPSAFGADGRLHIASPRLAHREGEPPREEAVTDDLVRRIDQRTFAHLGRSDRVTKIDGRRLDLGRVEHLLRTELGMEAACLPYADDLRGQAFDVVLEGVADRHLCDRVRELLSVQPRRIEGRPELPRTVRGKIDRQELLG